MVNLKKTALSLALFASCSSMAFADGNAFTPLNFEDSASTTYSSVPTASPVTSPTKSSNPLSSAMSKMFSKEGATSSEMIQASTGEVPIGNDNIQNAILELDNAQVGIRNELLDYKAKYADVDAQYKLIKNERKMLDKQVRDIERRIKNIDNAKEKIRKNML